LTKEAGLFSQTANKNIQAQNLLFNAAQAEDETKLHSRQKITSTWEAPVGLAIEAIN
jgi:hypothetical protein